MCDICWPREACKEETHYDACRLRAMARTNTRVCSHGITDATQAQACLWPTRPPLDLQVAPPECCDKVSASWPPGAKEGHHKLSIAAAAGRPRNKVLAGGQLFACDFQGIPVSHVSN